MWWTWAYIPGIFVDKLALFSAYWFDNFCPFPYKQTTDQIDSKLCMCPYQLVFPKPPDLTISVKTVFVTGVSAPAYRLPTKNSPGGHRVTSHCSSQLLCNQMQSAGHVVLVTLSTFSNLYFSKEWLLSVQPKNFHGSSDICLMDFIYSIQIS